MNLGDVIGPIIDSSLVNFSIFGNIYAPFDVIGYTNGEGTNRYNYVKAIRIQKCAIPTQPDELVKFNTFDDLQNFIKLLVPEVDLSKALEPITKDEFDSMEIPTLPL